MNEIQVDSVFDNCVRDDRPRDSGATDVPPHYGLSYVHAASCEVTSH